MLFGGGGSERGASSLGVKLKASRLSERERGKEREGRREREGGRVNKGERERD